jgi:glycosyltransferase involved in cell wall biosynthesis
MNGMKHIVVLTNWYYPVMGGPSTVFDRYIQALKKEYVFHVITKTNEYAFDENKDIDIQYITSFRHRLFKWCLYNIKSNKHVFVAKVLLFAIRLCMVIQTQYSFPDSRKWEINEYYRLMDKKFSMQPFDTVIAVSDNFVIQMAALKFKRKHPEVKWISFILDPYSVFYIYYERKLFKSLWEKANFRKEREIYNVADYCMFTPEMLRYVKSAFALDEKKIYPINFSLNNELEAISSDLANNVCKLVFAGMVYKDIRNPEFMLNVLSKIEDIQVDLYIKERSECEDILSKYNSEIIHRNMFVDRAKYIEMIRSTYDILINIGNISSLQSPSKTLELLSTGKPIINFYFENDSQYEMVDRYPLGLNIKNGEENAVEKVSAFCREMKGKRIPFCEVEKLYPENNLQKQVELLKNLIEV